MDALTYALDTHVVLWYFSNSTRLPNPIRTIISSPDARFIVSVVAIGELLWICRKPDIALHGQAIVTDMLADPRFEILTLTTEIVVASESLTHIAEMHDRQIVATALSYTKPDRPVVLLTKDENITASNQIPTLW